jgi:DNA-binding response OmpR family regulator
MTVGVIEREEPFLAALIALACESVGHDCLVFKDMDQVTRILHAIHFDAIVLDIHRPGVNGLDWLETMAPSWPDLPSRTLLLTNSELTPEEAARIERLGAEVVSRPRSLVDIELVVMDRLHKGQSETVLRHNSSLDTIPSALKVNGLRTADRTANPGPWRR